MIGYGRISRAGLVVPSTLLLLLATSACALGERVDPRATPDGGSAGTGGSAARGSGGTGGATGGSTSASSGGTGAAMPNGVGGAGGAVPDAGGGTDAAATDPCALAACAAHGVCTATAQGASCACDEGFSGADCDTRTGDYGRRLKIAENLADPDVLKLADDRYVLSGTGSGFDFRFLESRDLVTWDPVATYDPSTVDPNHDYCFLWAPDIAQVDGALTLLFSAYQGPKGGTTCPPPSGSDVTTFRAASPDGSYRFGVPELLFQGQGGAQSRIQSGCPAGGCGQAIRIDPAVYGGRLYYVYFDKGNNVASVSLTNPADFVMHTGPAGWTLNAFEESINEGPEILERGGSFYLFFSAAWYNSQYATFYVKGNSAAELTRALPLGRLTTPVRRASGSLIETHGHNSIVTIRGETFNFFHVGVFDGTGGLIRRDTYRQRIAWNLDGTAISQNEVRVSWNDIGGGNAYSLDLVLRDGTTVGPCIAVGRIGQATSTTFDGVCPDANDRLIHKSEVQAFRLYASPSSTFVQVGETPYDGYSEVVGITAAP